MRLDFRVADGEICRLTLLQNNIEGHKKPCREDGSLIRGPFLFYVHLKECIEETLGKQTRAVGAPLRAARGCSPMIESPAQDVS